MCELPTRTLSNFIGEYADFLLEQPSEKIGTGECLARATYLIPLIELAYCAYFENDRHDNAPGFFDRDVLRKTAARLPGLSKLLKKTVALPAVRLRDGPLKLEKVALDWKYIDRSRLRDEIRSNLRSVLAERPVRYQAVALKLHVLLELRMRFNAPEYIRAIEEREYEQHHELGAVREYFLGQIPALRSAA